MQAVTCFQCGRDSWIAPDAFVCQHCGEDLQHLLLSERVAHYFQARAHEFSERGELGAALAEAERGLTYADSSELHLLAAILAKQLGRHDRMRQHVAAIAVDDSLRGEAEWLLRSHQDRARALQEAARHGPVLAVIPNKAQAPADDFLDELLRGQTTVESTPKHDYGQAVASVAIIVVAITLVAASWWWLGPGMQRGLEADGSQAANATTSPTTSPTTSTVANRAGATSVVLPVQLASNTPAPTPVVVTTPTFVLLPTPTPALPANLVQAGEDAPELADSSPSSVVVVESSIFNIRQYLREQGYAELAALTVDARVQGETLMLQGFVHLDVQRRQLIEIARAVPGVREVNAVNLLLRPLPTYVVQMGDTLWSIVFNIYGNVDRLDEFAAYNRDVLPSPDALRPGMELRVLPVQ